MLYMARVAFLDKVKHNLISNGARKAVMGYHIWQIRTLKSISFQLHCHKIRSFY